jgi:5-formyltetrahydrofolate cyclo-ligase
VEPGAFGIPEPKGEFVRKVEVDAIDLFILPGVAFDIHGNRLGYGEGYYDRILGRKGRGHSALPHAGAETGARIGVPLVGLAFELQLVDSIPFSVHDVRVHRIVTENRVINCSQA